MRRFRDFPIQRKLMLVIALCSLIALLLAGAAFLVNDWLLFRQNGRNNLTTIAEILASNSTAALTFNDDNAAVETLKNLSVKPSVRASSLYSKNGRLFAKYIRNGINVEVPRTAPAKIGSLLERNQQTIILPVMLHNERIGTIWLQSDLQDIYASLVRGGAIVSLIMLLSFFFAVFISSKLQRVISKPILDLANTANIFSNKKDYSLRAEKYGEDEIGQLTDAFNQMLIEIQRQNTVLQNVNEELQKQVEERTRKIREDQIFLDSIIENIPNMIFIKEAGELRFIRLNRAGEDLLGYSKADLKGKSDYDFFPKTEADFFTAKDREVLARRKALDIPEESIHTKKGVRFLHTKKVPIYSQDGKPQYLLGISEDITEKKLAQEEILQKTEQLIRSKTEIEQLELFAFATTHDLQEPLRKIMLYTDLLATQGTQVLDKKMKESLDRIRAGADRMHNMMIQLRELSRIGTGGGSFEAIEVNPIVREVLGDLELRIAETQAHITAEGLPVISADKTQMYQLFHNLIGNAIKFRRPDEPPRVRISSRPLEGGFTEITVEDNGIGFDEKYLDRIFKPFQRLHRQEEYEGSGMGLTICQKIVLRHGATISAKSLPEKGSSFIICLPLATPS